MGFLLKEALKSLCASNRWSYAVFWKIGCQNPKLLIWEEYHYESLSSPVLPSISKMESPELLFDEWEGCWFSPESRISQLGAQSSDTVHLLINKMMMTNQVNIVGQGMVGRAALTGNHQWILLENYIRDAHPSEVLNDARHQFSAGMQTVAVVPVLPHGVVQFGSTLHIMEDLGFVSDVKSLILQLGCVPGALLSDNQTAAETSPNIGKATPLSTSISAIQSGNFRDTNSATFNIDSFNQQSDSSKFSRLIPLEAHMLPKSDHCCQPKVNSEIKQKLLIRSQMGDGVAGAEVLPSYPDPWLNWKPSLYNEQSRYDQPAGGQSDGIYSSVGLIGSQILTHAGVRDHVQNNPSVSSSITTSHCRRTGGLIVNSREGSVKGSEVPNCISSYLNSSSIKPFRSVPGRSAKTDLSPILSSADRLTNSQMILGGIDERNIVSDLAQRKRIGQNDLFQGLNIPTTQADELVSSSEYTPPPSGDDLFDVLGVDLKNKLLNRNCNNFVMTQSGAHNFDDYTSTSINLQGTVPDFCLGSEGISDSGISPGTASDHLLDAVISKVPSAAKQSSVCSDDNISCRTTLSKITISNQKQGQLFGIPTPLAKPDIMKSNSVFYGCSKEATGNGSQTSSIYGSQISSWVEQGKRESSVSTGYSKRPDDISKSNRKRLKPGENPRPRPKDRQMIQDRVKELREIVPNGAKCSIDALLERTIKHMLFLQSVTKHADKLKQTEESKITSREGGLLLKDNFEGGATWAFEVGSQSMVCPIIVEDLNPPRQLLVEMLCEERGVFLEIADLIRSLGLTILKGVMEARNDKIWARFAVEANRDVTRMEIFLSLVHLLEQTVKSTGGPAHGNEGENMMLNCSFHQPTSIPATGMPTSLQ